MRVRTMEEEGPAPVSLGYWGTDEGFHGRLSNELHAWKAEP